MGATGATFFRSLQTWWPQLQVDELSGVDDEFFVDDDGGEQLAEPEHEWNLGKLNGLYYMLNVWMMLNRFCKCIGTEAIWSY